MEQRSNSKLNRSIIHHLTLQHKINETTIKQEHLMNLRFYKFREEKFKQKTDHLRGNLEPCINHQQTLITRNYFTRINTQFHLLKFPPEVEKRLLSQTQTYYQSNKQISHHLPSNSNVENDLQMFLTQQKSNEYQNQTQYIRRKADFLKEFNELKHTINDPNSTLSSLAALSRALLSLESGIK